MITLLSLWLPILLSAVGVFLVSSIIHMVLQYHNNDFIKVPEEDEFMEALRKFSVPPGDYVVPYAGGSKELKSPEFMDKQKKGPLGFFTLMEYKSSSMVKSLIHWFIYCIVVGVCELTFLGMRVIKFMLDM